MWDPTSIELLDDKKLLALALRIAEMAAQDGSQEFDDIRWIADILEKGAEKFSKLSFGTLEKSVYVRLRLAEARLSGRKAYKLGQSLDSCPVPEIVGDFDDFHAIWREHWTGGYESAGKSIELRIEKPSLPLSNPRQLLPAVQLEPEAEAQLNKLAREHVDIKPRIREALGQLAARTNTKSPRLQKPNVLLVPSDAEKPAIEIVYCVQDGTVRVSKFIPHGFSLPF